MIDDVRTRPTAEPTTDEFGAAPGRVLTLTAGRPDGPPFTTPASYAQERIWFASQVADEVAVYHVPVRVYLRGALSAELIVDCFARLVERHESLRTTLHLVGADLLQRVHTGVRAELPCWDTTGPRADDLAVERATRSYLRRLLGQPLPLDQPPLWRAALLRSGEEDWSLLMSAHHAILDGASVVTLSGELTELCAAAAGDRAATLGELPLQYADYAAWQRDQLDTAAHSELDAFWRDRLHGLPAVHRIATDRPRPAERSFTGSDVLRRLPGDIDAQLAESTRALGVTDFMYLCAVYVAVLHRWSQQDDIVLGLPVTGRDRPQLHRVIGMFVNMVVLRIDAAGDPTFRELAARVRDCALDALDHQQMPFQRLVQMLAGQRDPAVPPLYQLGFNYLPMRGLAESAGSMEDDLMCEVGLREVRIEYNTALFTEATAARLADDYRDVLDAVLADPDRRLSTLPGTPRPAEPAAAVADVPAPDPTDAVAPRSAAEQLVAQTWAELLGVADVGAFDDFFALGGHSLLALRVIARLRSAAEVDLSIQEFFEDTTVAGVAAALERAMLAEIEALTDDEAAGLADEGGPR